MLETLDDIRRDADARRVGNVAEMREALCDIVMLTMKVGHSIRGDVACGIIASKAKHAIAKPPRNCDLYDSKESARKAHEEYRSKYILAASNKFDFPMEFDDWLFAPATERKGQPDGK